MTKTCAICQTVIQPGEDTRSCDRCLSEFHAECWQENGGCATYACENAPNVINRDETRPPPVGVGTRFCPMCGERIGIASITCPFCHEHLAGAEPLSAEERQARMVADQAASQGKVVAIIIFIAGLLGCLAPLNLVFGGIWYGINKRSLAKNSPMHNLLAVSGLVFSVIYLLVLLLFLVLKKK